MRSQGAIKQKLKQVRYRHLKKLLDKGLRRVPDNCSYNRSVAHPDIVGDPIGSCIHPDQGLGTNICDVRWNGIEKSRECCWFEFRRNKAEIKSLFRDLVEKGSPGEIALHYPDVAALMWVLGDDQVIEQDWDIPTETDSSDPVNPQEDLDEPPARVLTWWERLWGVVSG